MFKTITSTSLKLISFFCFLSTATALADSQTALLKFLQPLNGTWVGEGSTQRAHVDSANAEVFSAEVTFNLQATSSNFYHWQHFSKLTYIKPDIAKGMCALSNNIQGRWADSQYFIGLSSLFKNYMPPDGPPVDVTHISINKIRLTWGYEELHLSTDLSKMNMNIYYRYTSPDDGKVVLEERFRLQKRSDDISPLVCVTKKRPNSKVSEFITTGRFEYRISQGLGLPLISYFEEKAFGYDLVPQALTTRNLVTGEILSSIDLTSFSRIQCGITLVEWNQTLFAATCTSHDILVFDLGASTLQQKISLTPLGNSNSVFGKKLNLVAYKKSVVAIISKIEGLKTSLLAVNLFSGDLVSETPLPKDSFLLDNLLLTQWSGDIWALLITQYGKSLNNTFHQFISVNVSKGSISGRANFKKGFAPPILPSQVIWNLNTPYLAIVQEDRSCWLFVNAITLTPNSASTCYKTSTVPEIVNYGGQQIAIDFDANSLLISSLPTYEPLSNITLNPSMTTDSYSRPLFRSIATGLFMTYLPAAISLPVPVVNLTTGARTDLSIDVFQEAVRDIFSFNGISYAMVRNIQSGRVTVLKIN